MENFSWKKLFDFSGLGYVKLLGGFIKLVPIIVAILVILFINSLFSKSDNVNQPNISVADGGSVTYQNVQNESKDNEIGIFGGPIYHDEDLGWFGGLAFKRKF